MKKTALPLAFLALFLWSSSLRAQVSQLDPAIAKWEKQIVQLEQTQATEPKTKDSIVFYGSSSIRRWENLATDMAPWPTVKRGYGGAKLPDIIHYAPRMLSPHLGVDNPHRCRAVVVFVANDINGKGSNATPAEVAKRFDRLHKWIRDQDPTVPLFWIEVTPTLKRWAVWPEIANATTRIAKITETDANAHLIATAGAYLGVDGKPRAEFFVKDQLHLNETGYQLWSALIKAQLNLKLGAAKPWEKPEPQQKQPSRNP